MHNTFAKDIYVHVSDNKIEATVNLVIFSKGTEQGQLNNFEEIFTVELKLIKTEEKWLIKNIEAAKQTL